MSKLIIKKTEDIQSFDVQKEGSSMDGTITNKYTDNHSYIYITEEYEQLTSEDLRDIADELDRLNRIDGKNHD